MDIQKLKAQLESEEGRRSKIYTDTRGNPTIGVGRCLATNPLSDDEIDYLLANDIKKAEAGLRANTPWALTLDDVRLRVMYDLCFNMGINKLMTFARFLFFMKGGDFENAAKELQDSLWYRQVGLRGPKLVKMVQTGEDP